MQKTKPIPQFENYTLSTSGIITNTKTGKPLTPYIPNGQFHLAVSMRNTTTNKRGVKTVATLMLQMFKGAPSHNVGINYKDGNRSNLDLDNLTFSSAGKKIIASRKASGNLYEFIVDLTPSKILELVKMWNEGATATDISKKYKVSGGAIRSILTGRTHSEITGITSSLLGETPTSKIARPKVEVWTDIKGWDDYRISNRGNFTSSKYGTEEPRKPSGYPSRITLSENSKQENKNLGAMVLEHFVAPRPIVKKYVAYWDGDASNCNIENLYWSSVNRKWGTPNKSKKG